jgi:hypothetical protein
MRVDDRDDRGVLRDFVGGGDWPPAVVGDAISGGNAGCNIAARDHNDSTGKKPCDKAESNIPVDEKRFDKGRASVSRGRTGQPAPIMAG